MLKSEQVRARIALYGMTEGLAELENRSELLETIRPPKRMKNLN
jgi:hypothetical protein